MCLFTIGGGLGIGGNSSVLGATRRLGGGPSYERLDREICSLDLAGIGSFANEGRSENFPKYPCGRHLSFGQPRKTLGGMLGGRFTRNGHFAPYFEVGCAIGIRFAGGP